MTSTTRIPGKELDGVFGAILKVAMRKKVGSVPEGAEVLWHHRRVFMDSMKMGRYTEKWDRLDRTLASYAAMATAAEIGCNFCLDLHYFLAHHKGLDEAKAREVPRWRESSVFTPTERRVMEYAVAMCQTSPTVTDELAAALLADLGPDGLVELASRVAFMNMSARMNVALGIGSEQYADSCGLPPLAAPTPVLPTPALPPLAPTTPVSSVR